MYYIRIYNVLLNMFIFLSVVLQKNIIYFKLFVFLFGILKFYIVGLLLCLLRIKIKVYFFSLEFESFEGIKFVFMYGKSFKKEENLYVYV